MNGSLSVQLALICPELSYLTWILRQKVAKKFSVSKNRKMLRDTKKMQYYRDAYPCEIMFLCILFHIKKKKNRKKHKSPAQKKSMIFTEYNNQPCFKLIFNSSTGLDTEKNEIHTQITEYQPQLYKAEMLTKKKTDKVTEHVKIRMLKAWKRQHADEDNSWAGWRTPQFDYNHGVKIFIISKGCKWWTGK